MRAKGIAVSAEMSESDMTVGNTSSLGEGYFVANPYVAGTRKKKLRVLLVEDDAADAYLIRRALKTNPRVSEVVLAENGVEALELIERGAIKPDLAFVDLRMPRKDGFALLRDFASTDAKFPSVVLTSSKSGEDTVRSKKRGAIQFVTKPRTEQKLAAALGRVIAMI